MPLWKRVQYCISYKTRGSDKTCNLYFSGQVTRSPTTASHLKLQDPASNPPHLEALSGNHLLECHRLLTRQQNRHNAWSLYIYTLWCRKPIWRRFSLNLSYRGRTDSLPPRGSNVCLAYRLSYAISHTSLARGNTLKCFVTVSLALSPLRI